MPTAEYNPFESVRTNVIGAMNVITCIDQKVKKVIALSTDKASNQLICTVLQSFVQISYLKNRILIQENTVQNFRLCVMAM